jgi:hypothetical protein
MLPGIKGQRWQNGRSSGFSMLSTIASTSWFSSCTEMALNTRLSSAGGTPA